MKTLRAEITVGRASGGQLRWVDSMPAKVGSRVARQFFFQLARELCKQSYEHWLWEQDDYYPLAYGERYLYSHVAMAIGSLTPFHLSEHGIKRNSRTEDRSIGRVDFWANYRKTNFLLELKRVAFGFRGSKWPKKLTDATEEAFQQAKSLKREAVGDWAGGAAMAGLCIALPYSGAKERNLLKVDDGISHAEVFLRRASIAANDIRKGPNFAAVWTPPKRAQFFETESAAWEHIPFVGFLGRVNFSVTR